MLLLLVTLLLCSFIAWLFYVHYYKPYYVIRKTLRLSGPPPFLFYGNYKEAVSLGYLESRKKWVSKYGTTFLNYLGIKPVVVTQDLEIIRSVLVKNFDQFINRAYNPPLLKRQNEETVPGLLFARGEVWRRMRHILTPMFSSKKIKMMSPLIQERCESLKEMSSASISGKGVDVWKWFGQFTIEVILVTLFGTDFDTQRGDDNPFVKAVSSVFQNTANEATLEKVQMILSHFPWMEWALKKIGRQSPAARSYDYMEDTSLKIMEDRRKRMPFDSPPQDLLQLLLEAHKENETGRKSPLSNEEIIMTIITILLAGSEATSCALGFTLLIY